MRFIPKINNQKGDTIMEVLLSLAVLALILTSSFALANRNAQANRQAAERGEAFKIAQGQLEKLKLYLSTDGPLPAPGTYFCMKDDNTIKTLPGNLQPIDSPTPDYFTNSASVFSTMGAECGPEDDLYYPAILRGSNANPDGLADINTFKVYVRWFAVTGNGIDQATMVHRLYPDGVL